MILYRQCTLIKGACQTVAWIPGKYAVVGKVLDLRDADPLLPGWSYGWVVGTVHATWLPEDYVKEHEADYRTQRRASDI